MMVKRVFLEGRLHTFLVAEGEGEGDFGNPVFDTLQAQAERIDFLEQQNQELLHREQNLMRLLEITSETHRVLCSEVAALSKRRKGRSAEDEQGHPEGQPQE